MWSVECRVWSVECGVWSVECGGYQSVALVLVGAAPGAPTVGEHGAGVVDGQAGSY